MGNRGKNQADTETILMALDQISQTIDVMTSVVGRLRAYMSQHESDSVAEKNQDLESDSQSDRIVH